MDFSGTTGIDGKLDVLDIFDLIAAQIDEQRVDPRLALLARASAWLALVEHETATLDEAIEALTPAFYTITTSPCACDREMVERWEAVQHRQPAPPWALSAPSGLLKSISVSNWRLSCLRIVQWPRSRLPSVARDLIASMSFGFSQ
jgi:hypothetical protein